MGDRKSILVVEDNRDMLSFYSGVLRYKYNVIPIFYLGDATNIPSERFDGAIVDGLYGNWERVAKKIDAEKEKIFIISSEDDKVARAIDKGYGGINKGDLTYDKLEAILG